ncbi:F-box only protein 15 [Aulostomus maculatus]
MAAPRAVVSRARRAGKPSPASAKSLTERLPTEILGKILSYLDPPTLFTLIHVNKVLHQLANDNDLWYKIYREELSKNRKWRNEVLLPMDTVEVTDLAAGYWKWQYLKYLAECDMNKWKRHSRLISRHTGLPSQTEQILKNMHVTWVLTVSDKSGYETTFSPCWFHIFETSVTLGWTAGCWPDYQQISTLKLYGVRRIALNCRGLKKPGWKSLMETLDMEILQRSMQHCGEDKLVELKSLKPGIIMGIWKVRPCVAFLMVSLHFNRLLEKSIQGWSVGPDAEPVNRPPYDDIDPEYGLHGYHLHVVLHTSVGPPELMSESFSQLFCRKDEICNGLIKLTAISRAKLWQHKPLSGDIALPWRCEALQGKVENHCIMTLTLLDEFKNPFWCVSSLVAINLETTATSCDYDYGSSEDFLLRYEDSGGQVHMNFVRMKEQMKCVLVSLVVYVSTSKVNQHFGRDY